VLVPTSMAAIRTGGVGKRKGAWGRGCAREIARIRAVYLQCPPSLGTRHSVPVTRYPSLGTRHSVGTPTLSLEPKRDPVVFVDDSGDGEPAGLGPVGDRRLITAEQAGEGE